MNLMRWNPWREMVTLQNRFNRLLDDPFFRTEGENAEDVGTWYPAVDMFENDDSFVIKAELPGMEKKDISVDVKDRVLTLTGERNHDNEVKEKNYYRRERSYGKFQRSFMLPADVDPDKIKADFKNGLLKIEVPKPEGQTPKQSTIH
ncbi:MAG: Hsp20/alpha crystallin family protein [Desulfobacterales bacterium]|nr:MAG: Hsp20/alpha crystallin family protein [Desulfobacterales bacterium]